MLVVDDDDASRRLIVELLRDADYEAVAVDGGAEALRELRRSGTRYDLMVLDIQMPGVDGMSVAREVRRDPRLKDLPILAVTALARPADAARAIEAGCDAYLSKPAAVADVRRAVADLIGGTSGQRSADCS